MSSKILKVVFSTILLNIAKSQINIFADGGYQNNFPPCIESWTYKEKLADGTNLETKLNGCVNIDDFQPYPYFGNEAAEIQNLLEPQDSRTDKSRWCAVERDVYNPTPLRTEENRLNWGYCLDITIDTSTDSPVTSPPSKLPTTKLPTNPVPDDSTARPTKSPTKSKEDEPTKDQTSSPTFVEEAPETPSPDNEEETSAQTTTSSVALTDWTFIGIGIACVLLLVAVVLIVVMARKYNGNVVVDTSLNEAEEDDLEENSTNVAQS